MDHHFRCGANGIIDEHEDRNVYGRRPTGFYIPRFRNLFGDKREYLRGFGYQGSASRQGWERAVAELGVGARVQGRDGDARAVADRRHGVRRDAAEPRQPRLARRDEEGQVGPAGAGDRLRDRRERAADAARHDERHGRDARGRRRQATCASSTTATSRAWASTRWARRAWAAIRRPRCSTRTTRCGTAPNVFVTDGSCMTSAACQNPSLTYMALTARAAAFAVDELKRGNL